MPPLAAIRLPVSGGARRGTRPVAWACCPAHHAHLRAVRRGLDCGGPVVVRQGPGDGSAPKTIGVPAQSQGVYREWLVVGGRRQTLAEWFEAKGFEFEEHGLRPDLEGKAAVGAAGLHLRRVVGGQPDAVATAVGDALRIFRKPASRQRSQWAQCAGALPTTGPSCQGLEREYQGLGRSCLMTVLGRRAADRTDRGVCVKVPRRM